MIHQPHRAWVDQGRPIPQRQGWTWGYVLLRTALTVRRYTTWQCLLDAATDRAAIRGLVTYRLVAADL